MFMLIRFRVLPAIALFLLFSFPAGAEKASERRNPAASGESLSPQDYFQLVLERQRLEISSCRQILKLLRAHNNDPARAMHDLLIHREELEARVEMLYRKYGTTARDYHRSCRGAEVQKERALYLDKHPGIRDKIAKNSSNLASLEREIGLIMPRLWTSYRGA